MAKGQKRSNREIRKPKKEKPAAPAPVVAGKAASPSNGAQRKPFYRGR